MENPFAGEHFVSEKYLIFRMMDANMAYRYYSSIHFIINGNNTIEKEFSSLYFKRKKILKRQKLKFLLGVVTRWPRCLTFQNVLQRNQRKDGSTDFFHNDEKTVVLDFFHSNDSNYGFI